MAMHAAATWVSPREAADRAAGGREAAQGGYQNCTALLAGMQRNVSTRATLMTNDSCLFGAGLQVLFEADAE